MLYILVGGDSIFIFLLHGGESMGMKQLAAQLLKEIALAPEQQATPTITARFKAKQTKLAKQISDAKQGIVAPRKPVKTTAQKSEKEKENYKIAFELYSQMKIAELKALLQRIISEQEDNLVNARSQAIAKGKINAENLKPLIDFFNAYVTDVTNTPLNFNYNRVLSNSILQMLAKELAPVVEKNVLQLLFPNLQLTDELKKYKFDHLQQVVVSDDGKTFIDVKKCLDAAAESVKDAKDGLQRPLFHTHPVSGVKQELSAAENWRVLHHMEPSFFAYEKAGRERIFAALHNGITNRNELIAAMQKFATNYERKQFLKTFTPEELYKITLGEPGFNRETFRKVLKDKSTYYFDNKSKHDECATFLLIHVYGRYTSMRPNQYSGLYAAWAPSFMNSAQPANKKSDGVTAIENYYLEQDRKFMRIHTVSKTEAFKGCKEAIEDGLLSELFEQIKFVANPQNYNNIQPEKPRGWFGK